MPPSDARFIPPSEIRFIIAVQRLIACIIAGLYCTALIYLHRAFVLDFRGLSWRYSSIDGGVLESLDTYADPVLSALHPSTRSLALPRSSEAWTSSVISMILIDCILVLYAVYSIVIGRTLLFSRIVLGVTYASVLSCATYFPVPSDGNLPYTAYMRSNMIIDPITLVRAMIFLDAHVRFGANLFLISYGMGLLSLYSLVARMCYTVSVILGLTLAYHTHHTARDVILVIHETVDYMTNLIRLATPCCNKASRGDDQQPDEDHSDKEKLYNEDGDGNGAVEIVHEDGELS